MEGMLGNAESINTTEAQRTDPDPTLSGVEVRLDNESVWSRFHSLGTEMILTEPGRRMFPCCRFRLRGLDPHRSYFLIMDFTPLDDFRHRWNGKTWERDGAAEPHPERPECFHPDSPAPGQHWMDGPVSFYKVKLTHSSPERDTGVLLHPMRRYQPRLYVLPAGLGPERSAPLEVLGVHMFTFPQTEFYAVTSYQNPRITRLKIDCNPFMLAFREDEPSARLIQNKLGLAPTGRSPAPESNHSAGERLGKPREESVAPLDPGSAEVGIRPRVGRPLKARSSRWRPALPSPDPARSAKRGYRRSRRMRGAWKAKAKWWSRVKYGRAAAVRVSTGDVSLQPDLEDVDGVLFVSFTAKEALDVHVGNMRKSPPSHTQKQTENSVCEGLSACDDGLTTADRISEQERVLLTHLKQRKNTQILHPALQQVGLKLSLLDPAAPIDLQYLGVHLPPAPNLTPSSHAPFVSRTGKTKDLTRIKGWMEKFTSQSAADSNLSAFSSDMLDEYLESEGQQIRDRAAVFSAPSPSPVVYQLPVRSSSYVRTLDSVLQTRVTPRRPPSRPPDRMVRSSSRSTAPASLPDPRPADSSGAAGKRSRRGRKRRRPQLSFNREAADGSPAGNPPELSAQEEQAVWHGRSPTYITSERASLALTSVLTPEGRTARLSTRVEEQACAQDFCRLGCVCDSLNRRTRGSTHCRRVQCMFSCGCFKHKILLIRSPEPSPSQDSLMAFPIGDSGSGSRPAPALPVTSLWKKSLHEDDPEPLFTPKPAGAARRAMRLHAPPPRPSAQVWLKEKVQEKEKDPVYLYLESMMTCARVRVYNSYPPPQVHLLPPKRPDETVSPLLPAEGCLTGPGVTAPEPTQVLEIISRCNWESHRSLVLKELFRCISTNRLALVQSIDVYTVELLSKNLTTYETGSTLTYKVCVSLRKKPEKTREHAPQKVSTLHGGCVPEEKHPQHFPLLSRVVPAGYLKAGKKTLVCSSPIKVNGKTYAQAKLLLGRMGALHPANRLAAFVTGRIKPMPNPSQRRVLSQTLPVRTLRETRRSTPVSGRCKRTVSQANQRKDSFKTPAAQTLAIYQAPDGIKTTPTLYIFSHNPSASHPVTSSKPGLVLNAVAPPTVAPPTVAPPTAPLSKSETVLPASALPPGQQVVLQPVAGMSGVNMCQFNGQMIQLVPVPAAPPSAGSAKREAQLPQKTKSVLNPARSPNTLPFISPTIHSVPGSSSFTLGSGVQSGFLAKNGTFSFRICPPASEGKTTGLEHTESGGTASTLLLPGGYRLIKLPMLVPPSVNPESSPAGSESTEKSPEGNPTSGSLAEEAREDPARLQSSVSITAEPSEAPADAPPRVITAEPSEAPAEAPPRVITTEPSEAPADAPPRVITAEPSEAPADAPPRVITAEPSEAPADAPPRVIKAEPSEAEPGSDAEHESECVRIKIEEPEDGTVKLEQADPEPGLKASESFGPLQTGKPPCLSTEAPPRTAGAAGFSCPLFVGPISAFSKRGFTFPLLPAHSRTSEEACEHACAAPAAGRSLRANRRPEPGRSRIAWLWKRNPQDDPRSDSSSALMYSSDGWTSEDSTEKSSEDEVDIEALEERDEMNLRRLRAKARRNTQRAAPHQALPKAKLVGVSHHAVRLMSDLPLYQRTWRLNQALRERKRQAELQQSLSSLRRTLSAEEHACTEALLRQARLVIGDLEDRSRALVAQKRALIQQHSHYQTLISQRSAAGHVEQETAALSSEPPQHSQSVVRRPSRLPNVVLQSFTKSESGTETAVGPSLI